MNATDTITAPASTIAGTSIPMPQVGEGMTLRFPQDSYPYVIVRVSDSGKTVWAKPVKTVDKSTGHEPARFDGPYPVWSHTYTSEELAELVETEAPERAIRLSKHGYWTSRGLDFGMGEARYHRNYSY